MIHHKIKAAGMGPIPRADGVAFRLCKPRSECFGTGGTETVSRFAYVATLPESERAYAQAYLGYLLASGSEPDRKPEYLHIRQALQQICGGN